MLGANVGRAAAAIDQNLRKAIVVGFVAAERVLGAVLKYVRWIYFTQYQYLPTNIIKKF